MATSASYIDRRGAEEDRKAKGKSVNFLDPSLPEGVNRGGFGDSLNQQQQQKLFPCDQAILTLPYEIRLRTALFRELYGANVGRSVQAKKPGLGQLGIDPRILSLTVKKLGFTAADEEELVESENSSPTGTEDLPELNMLVLTSARCSLHLGGPNYLVIKPFVPRMYFMCTKWFLVQSMRRIEDRMRQRKRSFRTGSGRVFSHEEFTPFTLNLNNKNLEEILSQQPGVYLAKPANGSMGQRQQLVRISPDRVQGDLLDFLLSSQFLEMRSSQVILQRYIERPLLVDKRKFDLRVYMLVVNAKKGLGQQAAAATDATSAERRPRRRGPAIENESGYFVFMHPGFLRLCTAPYDPDQSDLAVHLTNQSIQAKLTSTFSQLKEVTTWYPDELNNYLNRRRKLNCKDWTKQVLYPKVGAILGYISAVFRRYLDDRDSSTNTFRILGVDFLVDEQLRVYLLEINSHPSWGRQTSVLNRLKPSLWREATCLTSEVILRYRHRQLVRDDRLVTRQNFRMIYSSEKPGLARQNVARLFN